MQSDNMPSKGNSLSRGRGNFHGRRLDNNIRHHQLRFCKTEINRRSDVIESIIRNLPSKGNSLSRGRGNFHGRRLGNDIRHHQLRFCKTEINRRSDVIESIIRNSINRR